MFSAAHAIAELDDALAKAGEDVSLRHMAAGAVASAQTVRALVRGYRPQEIAGAIIQGDGQIIISPTGLTTLPKKLDQVVVAAGVPRTVQAAEIIRMGSSVVRIVMQVRG